MPRLPQEVGIVSSDFGALRDRLRRSELNVAPPEEALPLGNGSLFFERMVLPTHPTSARTEDMALFDPDGESKHPIYVVRLPKTILDKALQELEPRSGRRLPDPLAFTELIPGLDGVLLELRHDRPGSLTTSVNTGANNPITKRPAKTGPHIDAVPEKYRGVTYAVINGGPGPRLHGIATGIRRQMLTYSHHRFINAQVRAHVQSTQYAHRGLPSLKEIMRWIELRPPGWDEITGEPYVEAVIGSPVGEYLHEGSTATGTYEAGSLAVMASVDMSTFDPSRFRSVFDVPLAA